MPEPGREQAACDHHKDMLCPSCSPSITRPYPDGREQTTTWEPGDPVYPQGCTAAVDIAGQPYPCEVRGEHETHANREAEAIWQGAS